jgi:hypothetical protein
MPCPRDATGLWHACVFSWVYGKNHKKKSYGEKLLQSQCFQGKKYKTKFSTSLILKK